MIVATALILCTPAAAQEIIVTGRGLEASPGEAAYPVVEIDRDRLASAASGRLEDVLRDAAGIAQFRRSDSRSAHPTSQGVTLRGLGGNASSRALLILDGVPQADPFGGWVAFPAYLPDRLASARVLRGGGSGIAGPGALAGTIELASGTPAELGALNLAAWYGSRDSIDATAVGAATLGEGFATFAGQYARGDGFTPIIAAQRGPVDRPARYEQASGAVRAVTRIGDGTELQANVSAFTDRRDRGVDFTDLESRGADASVRLVGRGDWGWSALAYVQTRGFASGFASVSATRTTVGPSLDQYDVPAIGLGARVEVQPPIGVGMLLRLGTDVRGVSGETRERYSFAGTTPANLRRAGGESLTAGAFADLSVETGAATFNLGGRLDHWRIRDGFLDQRVIATGAVLTDNRFPNRNGWEATGRAGAALKASEALSFRAAGYRGGRLPTLNELYRPFRVGNDTTNANAALAPERLTGAEAGIDLTPAPSLTARATVFWNRLDDAIANVTISTTAAGVIRQRQNVDSVEAKGVELDLGWQRGPLRLSASWAYTDSRVHASGFAAPLDRLRPAQTPAHQASGTLVWRPEQGPGGSLTVRYIGPQYEDDQNRRLLADAVTLDAEARLPLTGGLELRARAENLTDTEVQAGISGAGVIERATPRTLWIGLGYRLR